MKKSLILLAVFSALAGYSLHGLIDKATEEPCPPCPEAVVVDTVPPCENSRVFCIEVYNQPREVTYDDMIMKIVEDAKVCVKLEPESEWLSVGSEYLANLRYVSRDVIRADTACFKTTDCTEEP